MSSTKQGQGKDKPGRKKLKLSKETLKDLTAADKEIKGGAPDVTRNSCSCNCE